MTYGSQLSWLVIILGSFYLKTVSELLPDFSSIIKSRLKSLAEIINSRFSLGDEKGGANANMGGSVSGIIGDSQSYSLSALSSSVKSTTEVSQLKASSTGNA